MAKKEFNLGDSLAGILGSVSPSDTEQIEYISLQFLVSDERNFYSLDGIDELAANIELVGLQQPLRVLKGENGFYVIVSGHRRAAALRLLAEEAPEKWDRVPCIVEKPGASPELEELRLIMANADTRRMSSADLAKQTERVETLLYKLKEQGFDFPGRMRDHVAEACKVSATKLAELRVIQKNLIPELRQLWDNNEINHAVAYSLAKASMRDQIRLTELRNEQEIRLAPEWRIDTWIGKLRGVAKIHCPDDGATCGNMPTREERTITMQDPCGSYCCVNCWRLLNCSYACEKAKKVAETKKAEREKQKAERKAFQEKANAERKERYEKDCEDARAAWARTLDLAEKNGLNTRALAALWAEVEEDEVEEDEIAQIIGYASGENVTDCAPWVDSPECLVEIANQLQCSTDYLLGRAEEPAPWTGAWISVDDRYPDEGDYCLVCTASRVVLPAVYFRASFMDFTEKSVANNRIQRVEYWMPLPKAPGDHKYTGQETLDSILNRSDAK
ncbi:MAG: ParB N-terminal domain-containing protein [Oscillospiraceae bacterium]|nr:ParB N-terminal domain-containing protein [Oscillospiraceae bacterium]